MRRYSTYNCLAVVNAGSACAHLSKKEGNYILAGIQGRIVTYRFSSDDASFLKDNSITDGDKLSWTIPLELIRKGDAYVSTATDADEDLF